MNDFDFCLDHVLRVEGGFVNNPSDYGGVTNWGVTKKVLAAFRNAPVNDKDVFNLSRAEAAEIYKANFWVSPGINRIRSRRVALIVFDQAVNRGPVAAIRMLQDVLNTYFKQGLTTDGVMGTRTEVAVSAVSDELLCRKLIQAAQMAYVDITLKNPQQRTFLRGWIGRTFALQDSIADGVF